MADPFIELSEVTLQYGGGTLALAQTDLRIPQGDFVALVGPSGCGKSTILKLVGGLLKPSSGAVVVAKREVAMAGSGAGAGAVGVTAKVRIGLAFQNPTMLPWLTIRENVMIPLKIVEPFRKDWARKKKGEFAERADALLAQVGLQGFGDKRPWQLSGGMLGVPRCAPSSTSRSSCCWTNPSARWTGSRAR
jgi:NitT/TauT family transport system ATP-binding protein